MPIYRDKARGCFVFEFDREIEGSGRVRARKQLPKAWNQAQADAFDRQESARLYAIATGLTKQKYTIEDAVSVYLKDRVPSLKSGYDIAHELALIYWAYKGKPLESLADVCREYMDEAIKTLAPATVRKRIRYLTAACRWAWKRNNMGESDPGARVIVPEVRNERQVYIDRAQMIRLARACTHRETRAAIRIAFYSGMRWGEIARAERVLSIPAFVLGDTKNGEPRIVPMHRKLFVCAKYEMPTRFIMHYNFTAAKEAAGMPDLHFHDLRHSTASELLEQGEDLYTIAKVLGHNSTASTKRYTHLSLKKMSEAIGKIGQKIPRTHSSNKD
jgi:integrase